MTCKDVAALAAALAVIASAGGARAAILDEASVGGYMHDIVNITDGVESNLVDVQFELDSKRPAVLRILGAPRLNVTASFNGPHKTDIYGAGLVWDHRLFFRQLYVTLDFGLAYTDGVVAPPRNSPFDPNHYPRLLEGSSVLFRTVPGVEWRLDKHWLIGAQFVHLSNGDVLGSHHFNRGLNDVGMRVGYRF